MTEQQKRAVRNALVTLAALARHSLSPTQTKMATRGVGELLWLLKIDKVELDGRLYLAHPPLGEIVDIDRKALPRPNRTVT